MQHVCLKGEYDSCPREAKVRNEAIKVNMIELIFQFYNHYYSLSYFCLRDNHALSFGPIVLIRQWRMLNVAMYSILWATTLKYTPKFNGLLEHVESKVRVCHVMKMALF